MVYNLIPIIYGANDLGEKYMSLNVFLRSLVQIRNLGLLAVVLILFALSEWMPLFFVGLAIYFAIVLKKANNSEFQQACYRKIRIKKLRKLNFECMSLYNNIKKKIGRDWASKILDKVSTILGRNNSADLESRVSRIIDIKSEILNAFFSQEYTNLKEKIVFRSIELAVVYLNLMNSYASKLTDVSYSNLNSINKRIQDNKRKINMSYNSHYADEFKQAIEADEKLLQRLLEEKNTVEKMGAKLNVIESTMQLLKQQIYTEIQTDQVAEDIENTINETIALENALNEHFRKKKRI